MEGRRRSRWSCYEYWLWEDVSGELEFLVSEVLYVGLIGSVVGRRTCGVGKIERVGELAVGTWELVYTIWAVE